MVVALITFAISGCASDVTYSDRATVDADLHQRSGFHIGPASTSSVESVIAAMTSADGLHEDKAVDLALLNNAAFQEQLADLGLSRADVIQAGLITNPDAVVLFPISPKQMEATITAPVEALWLRGKRSEAAKLSADRTAARLTQAGLDLIRDVRLAYADLVLARRRQALFEEAAKLREQMSVIAQARVRAGEAIPLDAATAKIDAIRAEQEARSLSYGVTIAEERLRSLLGVGSVRNPIATKESPDAAGGDWNVDALLDSAMTDRSDIRAAALAVRSAQERADLARIEWINVSVVGDANEKGTQGFEAGPGIRFTLPIFNQNQGMIARADAEVERLDRQKRTLHDKVILEVREAHTRFIQAREDLHALQTRILPALDEAVNLARKAYTGGETSLVQVIDTNRQLLEARIREAQVASDLRRARAELERSVGQRLESRLTTPATVKPGTPGAPGASSTDKKP